MDLRRVLVRLGVGVAAAVLAGCNSSGGSNGGSNGGSVGAAAKQEAAEFRCPSGGQLSTATGRSLRAPSRSTFKTATIQCAYGGTGVEIIVSITFGVTKAVFPQIPKLVANGAPLQSVAGLGDQAYLVHDQGELQVFAHSGDRAVTVTGETSAAKAQAAARAFF